MAPLQISSAAAGSASHLRLRPTWVGCDPNPGRRVIISCVWPIGVFFKAMASHANKTKSHLLQASSQAIMGWLEWCWGTIICNLWPVIAQLGHFSPIWSNWIFSPYHPPSHSHYYDTISPSHFYRRDLCANQGQEMRAKSRQVFSAIWYRRKHCVRREGGVLHMLWTKQAWCWQ